MQAIKIENNIVTRVIEIPDIDESSFDDFIYNILNLDGEWLLSNLVKTNDGRLPQVGYIFDKNIDIFISPKPFESWFLDDDYQWQAPEKNLLRNPLYGYQNESETSDWFFWNEERKKWGVFFTEELIKKENYRTNGLFFISKAIDVQEYDFVKDFTPEIDVKCNPRAYRYSEAHPDWYPGYKYPIFQPGSYGEKYGITMDNPDKNYCYEFCQIIYDGAPYFYITHTNLCDLRVKYPFNGRYRSYIYEYSEELETEHMQQYPFIAARTLTELFRLIIDWDYLYHHEDNRENTAIVCHNILSSISMPEHIYKDIICNTDESILLKYKKYGSLKIRKPDEYIHVSDNIINWLVELYWNLRNLKHHEDVNVKNYDNKHYYL